MNNKTKKEFDLTLEHPKSQGFKLIKPECEDETTENFYRLKKELKEGFNTLKVVEQMESIKTTYFSKQSPNELEDFVERIKLQKEKIKGLNEEFGEKIKKLNVTIVIKTS